jgi:hypothetical protein
MAARISAGGEEWSFRHHAPNTTTGWHADHQISI